MAIGTKLVGYHQVWGRPPRWRRSIYPDRVVRTRRYLRDMAQWSRTLC